MRESIKSGQRQELLLAAVPLRKMVTAVWLGVVCATLVYE